ncbi:hypothetical protein [Pseudomonas sp. O39]|uniref:hypothetical protein n=1 Tax=Pseudomonas sp. O39 TaxID=3379130 RepID=UPI00387B6D17
MISLNLYAVREKQIESDRLASAVADFWKSPGGSYKNVPPVKPKPPPERRNWIDPETVLKRRKPPITRDERKAPRKLAEAL